MSAAGGDAQDSAWVVETTEETFARDCLDASIDRPVVIDFWASWCHPCRQLGPMLESLAEEYEGRFLLVKADTEQVPNIAASFGVQAIPAVYALRNRSIISQFVGLLPKDELKRWIDSLLPTAYDQAVAAAEPLEKTDPAAAETAYRDAISLDPKGWMAKVGLARVLLGAGRTNEARAVIEELESRGFLEPEAEQVAAAVRLRLLGESLPSIEESRKALVDQPENREFEWRLAQALASKGQYPEALELALTLIRAERAGYGEKCRQLMVDVFQVLGMDHELSSTYRRKLSAALY